MQEIPNGISKWYIHLPLDDNNKLPIDELIEKGDSINVRRLMQYMINSFHCRMPSPIQSSTLAITIRAIFLTEKDDPRSC